MDRAKSIWTGETNRVARVGLDPPDLARPGAPTPKSVNI